jgi:hypothetical protein
LSSSSRIRSADTIASALGHRRDGVEQLGDRHEPVAGDEPRRAQHPQRIVAEALVRVRAGVRSTRAARSAAPWNGSTSVGALDVTSIAIAFTVKSRRDRSATMSSENATSGLRESLA